jgi:hypothetical protein
MDFAITHPLQPSSANTDAEVREPGSWAAEYASRHKSQFAPACARVGVDFAPMVVETFGSWDPAALEFLIKIAEQYSIHQSTSPAYARKHLFTRLSVTLQRLNARMILARNTALFADEDTPHQVTPKDTSVVSCEGQDGRF